MRALTALCLALLALTACHNSGFQPMEAARDSDLFKEAPNPQHSYRLTMAIEGAPGPFGMVVGAAQYDVVNYLSCGKVNPATGTPAQVNLSQPLQWQTLAENRYTAVVHTDLMVDEDYYGNGVCQWGFIEARARLKATGAHEETRFVPTISTQEIEAEQSVTWYFWRGGYPRSRSEDFIDFGNQNPEYYLPELRNQLFTITMSSERIKE